MTIFERLVAKLVKVASFLQIGTLVVKRTGEEVKYNKAKFMPHEYRPFLEMVFEKVQEQYLVVNSHDHAESRKLFFSGYHSSGNHWKTALAWVRDNSVTIIMTLKGILFDDLLKYAGIQIKSSNLLKVSKYLKRLFSPYRQNMWQFFPENMLDIKVFQHPNEVIREGFEFPLDQVKAICDGFNFIHPDLVRSIVGYQPKIGQVFQGTVFWSGGFAKGHFVVEEISQDLILYFPKTDLVWNSDQVFIGFINPVEGSGAHTDVQSVVNFDMFNLLPEQVEMNLLDYWDKMDDPDNIKELLGMSIHPNDLPARHSLELAVQNGVDIREVPFLMSRLRKLFQTKLDDMHRKLRIEWKGFSAHRRYVLPDLSAFDRDGYLTGDCSLKSGEAFATGVEYEAMMAAHRQPNAHGEIVFASNKPCERLMQYNSAANAIFFSIWDIEEHLKVCGGADNDDAFLVYTGKTVVNHLLAQPQREVKVKSEDQTVENMFVTQFDFKKVLSSYMAKSKVVDGIGSYVNALIVDLACHRYLGKDRLLEAMNDDLEVIIDSFVKDSVSLDIYRKQRTDFWDKVDEVPMFLAGRIPLKHKERIKLIATEPDKVLEFIKQRISDFTVASRKRAVENSAELVGRFTQVPVPESVVKDTVRAYHQAYSQFAQTRDMQEKSLGRTLTTDEGYSTWSESVSQTFQPVVDKNSLEFTIVSLALMLYQGHLFFGDFAKRIDEGLTEFPDKILGHPMFLDKFLELASYSASTLRARFVNTSCEVA